MVTVVAERPPWLSPGQDKLFRAISEKFSHPEKQKIFEDSSKILGNVAQDSMYTFLLLLHKQGQITEGNVVIIKDYLAKQSSNKEEIEKEVDKYVKELPQERPVLTGRDDEIESIITKLQMDETAVINLCGASGVGKTALAKEICYQWKKGLIGKSPLTVDLREVKEMKYVYFHILQALEPNRATPISDEECAVLDRVRQLTKKDEPFLVLLDNSEQFAGGEDEGSKRLHTEFLGFLKRLKSPKIDEFKKLRILLTSRNQFTAANLIEDVHLKPLDKEALGELLKVGGEPSMDEEQKTKLIRVCGGKPLLLNAMVAALRQDQVNPEFMSFENENATPKIKGTSLDKKTQQPSGAENLEQASALDITKRKELEAGVQDTSILRSLFFNLLGKELQDAAVSLSLFCHPFSVKLSTRILDVELSKASFLLESLRSYGFITPGNPESKEQTYDIHTMLKDLVNDIKREEHFKQVYGKAEHRLARLLMEKAFSMGKMFDQQYADIHRIFNAEHYNTIARYDEVATSAFLVDAMFGAKTARSLFGSWAEIADQDGKDCLAANMWCWQALQVLNIEGSHKAHDVLKKAKTSLDKADGKDTDMFRLTEAKYRFALGKVYRDLYQEPSRALEEYRKSLNIMGQLLGDHTETTRCLNAIGNCYQHLAEPDNAIKYYRRAYDMRERLSGEEHYDMPVYKSQIGAVFDRKGDYDQAIQHYQSAIDLEKKLGMIGLGSTAIYYRNIANAYLYKDEYARAMEPAQKAYEIRNDILGKHPETTRSLFQLGLIWNLQNKGEKALNWYKQAWEMEKSLEKGRHSAVRDRIVTDLQSLYKELRRRKEKKLFEEDALEFYCRIWEEEKSFEGFQFTTANRTVINMIIDLHKSLGNDKAEMKSYQEEALGLYEKIWEERDTLPELKWDNTRPVERSVIRMRVKILEKVVELAQALYNKGKVQEFERQRLGFYRDVLFAEGSVEVIKQLGETFVKETLSFCERQWKKLKSKKEEDLSEAISVTLKLCKTCKDMEIGPKGFLQRKLLQYQKKALPILEQLWEEKQHEMAMPRKNEMIDIIVELATTLKKEPTVREYTKIKQNLENNAQCADKESSCKLGVKETDTQGVQNEILATERDSPIHHQGTSSGSSPQDIVTRRAGLQQKSTKWVPESREEDLGSREFEHVQNIPMRWLNFKKALNDAVKESANDLHLDVTAPARISIDKCEITDEKEFFDVLHFLRNQKIVAHSRKIDEADYLVFLEPQWLVNTLKEAVETKEIKGGLSGHSRSKSSDQPNEALVASMEKLFVVCRWPSPTTAAKVLVPQMLKPPLGDDELRPLLSSCATPPLVLKFPRGSNHEVLFLHLLMCLLEKKEKEQLGFRPSKPFQNFVRLYLDAVDGCSIVLLCNSPLIEVVLCTPGNPIPHFVGKTCRSWLRILEQIRLKYCLLKDTSYELCFFCPVCKQSSCSTHGVTGCNREECQHFYSEKELREPPIRCCKAVLATDPRVSTEVFSPWLDEHYSERESDTAQNRKSRICLLF